MKIYGKVISYNGFYGFIKGIDGIEYKVLEKDIITKDLKENDDVSFVGEVYETVDIIENMARFVRKIDI